MRTAGHRRCSRQASWPAVTLGQSLSVRVARLKELVNTFSAICAMISAISPSVNPAARTSASASSLILDDLRLLD
jgi:hypothetical protein